MNDNSRKRIAKIAEELDALKYQLEEVTGEAVQAADSLEDESPGTEQAKAAEETVNTLENITIQIENAVSKLENIG